MNARNVVGLVVASATGQAIRPASAAPSFPSFLSPGTAEVHTRPRHRAPVLSPCLPLRSSEASAPTRVSAVPKQLPP